jgi:hypothetical protein
MSIHRDFKGVWIPKKIWLNKNLSIMEKLFLVEIDSLDNEDGCYASNSHFSEMFYISKGRCTQIVKSLERKGFVKITLIRDKKIITKRLIRVVNKLNTLVNKLNSPSENIKQGYLENDEGNNTVINNTKGEINPSAFYFLKNNYPTRFETEFQMRFYKSIKNKQKFVDDYNDMVQIEMESKNLKWTANSLFSRLKQYARNWADNEKRYSQPEEDQKRPYLLKVR